MTEQEIQMAKKIVDFIFENRATDYCDAYAAALEILQEKSQTYWTNEDAIETILKAIDVEEKNKI